MYKLLPNGEIFHPEKGTIPCDERNSNYREYLEWVAAGNQPSPFNIAV